MAGSGLLLVHGAGSGPAIFDAWSAAFPGLCVCAVDLHAGLDVTRASMEDYAARVAAVAEALPSPVALCGWSMGGLVAMLAARRLEPPPHSLILVEPSPPAEIQGVRHDVNIEAEAGAFDPEVVYGAFPAGAVARPESSRARAERKRGISVPSLPCRTLVVCGDEFPDDRGRRVAARYGAELRRFRGLDHWGLVRHERVRVAIAHFLAGDA